MTTNWPFDDLTLIGPDLTLRYRDDGIRPHDTGDGVVDLQHLRLSRDDWAGSDARIPLEINGLDACRPFFRLR